MRVWGFEFGVAVGVAVLSWLGWLSFLVWVEFGLRSFEFFEFEEPRDAALCCVSGVFLFVDLFGFEDWWGLLYGPCVRGLAVVGVFTVFAGYSL